MRRRDQRLTTPNLPLSSLPWLMPVLRSCCGVMVADFALYDDFYEQQKKNRRASRGMNFQLGIWADHILAFTIFRFILFLLVFVFLFGYAFSLSIGSIIHFFRHWDFHTGNISSIEPFSYSIPKNFQGQVTLVCLFISRHDFPISECAIPSPLWLCALFFLPYFFRWIISVFRVAAIGLFFGLASFWTSIWHFFPL